MEIDIASVWLGQEDSFRKIFINPIIVDGFKFANLEIVEEWKNEMVIKYNRKKDENYLKKIKQYHQDS